jgi:hypothetical protein
MTAILLVSPASRLLIFTDDDAALLRIVALGTTPAEQLAINTRTVDMELTTVRAHNLDTPELAWATRWDQLAADN